MKNRLKYDVSLLIVKGLNILFMVAAFAFVWLNHYAPDAALIYFNNRGDILLIFIFAFLYVFFGRTYDAFQISMSGKSEMVYSQTLALLLSDAIMYLIIMLLTKHLPKIFPILIAGAVQVAGSAVWALLAQKWYFSMFSARPTVVVYDEREGIPELINNYGFDRKFDVIRTVDSTSCIDELSVLNDAEVVFLAGVHSHDRNVILKYCVANDKRTFVMPRIGDVIMSGARRMHMFYLPILRVERYHPSVVYLFIKRAFDIFASLCAMIILSPLLLITSIAIKASDGGPVIYRQTRLTKNGKVFKLLKFRSMRVDAEKDGVARLSTGDSDDRITPVGRVIRKTRIDELPQLVNILAGDLTVVGPRPERPEIAAQYEEEMPEFGLRLQAKAGLTGLAQVYGKYNTTPYDKLQMDLMYIAKPSLVEDLRIIFATVKVLFMPESTEGVSEGQTTAMSGEKR